MQLSRSRGLPAKCLIGNRMASVTKDTPDSMDENLRGFAINFEKEDAAMAEISRALKSISSPPSELEEVLRLKPKLLAFETPPSLFLRLSEGNEVDAVNQLGRYWKLKSQIFGEQSFLPLTFNKLGALDSNDEEVFKSGFIVCLPDDRKQRSVLCYDRTRLEMDFSCDLEKLLPSVAKCLFYLLSAMVRNKPSGNVHLVAMQLYTREFQVSPFDQSFQKTLYEVLGAFPFTSLDTEVVCHLQRGEVQQSGEEIVDEVMQTVTDTTKDGRLTYHESKTVLLKKLKENGFEKSGIPVSVGGSWVYFTKFGAWRRERETGDRLAEVTIAGGPESEKMVRSILRSLSAKQRKRRLAREHARRARKFERSDKQFLMESFHQLNEERRRLEAENLRLNHLLDRAKQMIHASFDPRLAPMAQSKTVGLGLQRHLDESVDSHIDQPFAVDGRRRLLAASLLNSALDTRTNPLGVSLGSLPTPAQTEQLSLQERLRKAAELNYDPRKK